ncbi:MAG: DUF6456 domain-containing protein [Hyphomicrobium sp.]
MPVATKKQQMASARQQPTVNPTESPIAWLRRRKDRDGEPMISQSQFDAGERLRADFWFAQMTPRVTANWSAAAPMDRRRRSGAASSVDMLDNVAAARERVGRALATVGPELAGVLIDVCCHLKGLEAAERAAGWPQRSGKVVLQLALTRLVRHYGLGENKSCARTGSKSPPLGQRRLPACV